MAKGLDTGDLIYQKAVDFDEGKETFASSYRILQESVLELLKQNWNELLSGHYEVFAQEGKGTYHKKCDMKNLINGHDFTWDMNIRDFKANFYGAL